jgi:hypothetical protein
MLGRCGALAPGLPARRAFGRTQICSSIAAVGRCAAMAASVGGALANLRHAPAAGIRKCEWMGIPCTRTTGGEMHPTAEVRAQQVPDRSRRGSAGRPPMRRARGAAIAAGGDAARCEGDAREILNLDGCAAPAKPAPAPHRQLAGLHQSSVLSCTPGCWRPQSLSIWQRSTAAVASAVHPSNGARQRRPACSPSRCTAVRRLRRQDWQRGARAQSSAQAASRSEERLAHRIWANTPAGMADAGAVAVPAKQHPARCGCPWCWSLPAPVHAPCAERQQPQAAGSRTAAACSPPSGSVPRLALRLLYRCRRGMGRRRSPGGAER